MVSQNNITNGFSEYLGHPWLVVCCPSTMHPAMACHPYGQDMEHHPAGGNHLMPVFLPADLADLASSGVSPLMENPSENPSETCRSSGIFGPISGKSPEETLQILVVDPIVPPPQAMWTFWPRALRKRQISADKYPLVMTNSSPWYRWPIEIDGLPGFTVLKNGGSFHGYVTNNQRVGFLIHEDCWIGWPGPVSHRKPCQDI